MNSPDPPRRHHRLFVAVWPDDTALDALKQLPRPDAQSVRWTPPANWHVTLRFLGDVPPDDVTARLERASLPAATAVVGPTVTRLGRDTLVVPVGGLDRLAATVVEATTDLGRPAGSRPFNGHLTLARLRGRADCTVLGTPLSASFDVTEVALVSSTTLPTGALYETVARYPTR
jgi:RNA 2',3'-cyclic 3'-phosphodiesterase